MPMYAVSGTVEYEYTHIIEADDEEQLSRMVDDMARDKTLKLEEPIFVAVDIQETIEDEDRISLWHSQADGYA
jgi:hypothetical protein